MRLLQLRPYQVEGGRAVMESVLGRLGRTFTVEIARQGGKNELSSQLEVLLLTLHMARGGNLVKCSPTFHPQTVNSILRLKERLNEAGYAGLWVPEFGYMVRLGRARQVFFSADKSSHVVGATAHILLEVDEAQDVDRQKYEKEFRPMGATTAVTTVLYGTAWDDRTLLEEAKQVNLQLERRDGVRRHFQYDWQEVARHNPDYGRYAEAERERLGESHPLFRTQYCLEPLSGGGRMFSEPHKASMMGTHPRQAGPRSAAEVHVAGVDLAGEVEQDGTGDAQLRALQPRRDSTVVTVARLLPGGANGPAIEVVDHAWWTGRSHESVLNELLALVKGRWACKRVVVDATGVGAGVASFLVKAAGRRMVQPFTFTAASKSALGLQLLAAVNGGRVRMYADDTSDEHDEFWREIDRARSAFRSGQTMNFYVDPTEGHDDFLMSLALVLEAGCQYQPRSARGRAREESD